MVGQPLDAGVDQAGAQQDRVRDAAIAEECQVYDQYGDYTRVHGPRVIAIEYTDKSRSGYTQACAAQGKQNAVIVRDRDVVAKGPPLRGLLNPPAASSRPGHGADNGALLVGR